jgi:hypothetical protein
MPRAYVDFSIFTPTSSVGVVSGLIDLVAIPSQGDPVIFDTPKRALFQPDISAFPTRLTVEHVLDSPKDSGADIMLSLEDVTVASREEALKVFAYFRDAFDLYTDEHETT